MKRTVVLMMVLGLVFGSMAVAEAGKKKKKAPEPAPPAVVKVERVVEMPYTVPNLGVATDAAAGGICMLDTSNPGECISIALQPGEAYVKVEVKDATGQKAFGSLSQGIDTDGDGINNLFGEFCGAHDEPVELISPSNPVQLSVYNGARGDCVPAIATTGVIVATFSNIP